VETLASDGAEEKGNDERRGDAYRDEGSWSEAGCERGVREERHEHLGGSSEALRPEESHAEQHDERSVDRRSPCIEPSPNGDRQRD
jgi:hypothetical protein